MSGKKNKITYLDDHTYADKCVWFISILYKGEVLDTAAYLQQDYSEYLSVLQDSFEVEFGFTIEDYWEGLLKGYHDVSECPFFRLPKMGTVVRPKLVRRKKKIA